MAEDIKPRTKFLTRDEMFVSRKHSITGRGKAELHHPGLWTASMLVKLREGQIEYFNSLSEVERANVKAILDANDMQLQDQLLLTPAQQALKARHGTLADFAESIERAIGTISVDEAVTAVMNYAREWFGARTSGRVTSFTNCARCHQDHTDIVFTPLTHKSGEHTHWATCPTNGQPIMMSILPD